MARYIMISAIVGAPPNGQYQKWPRGTTIADSAGNAVGSDVVWPSLFAAPSPVNLAPLDAAASAVMGLPVTTLEAVATSSAGGACGENVGV